jgi:hypothetical protein
VAFTLRICVSIILLKKLGVVGGSFGMCCVRLGTTGVDVASRSGTMVSFDPELIVRNFLRQKNELILLMIVDPSNSCLHYKYDSFALLHFHFVNLHQH